MDMRHARDGHDFLSAGRTQKVLIDRYAYFIGMQGMLSPMDDRMELIEGKSVDWVPNLPPHVSGVTNVHGFIVPVLDLNVLFTGSPLPQCRWMLMFGAEEGAVALKISTLPVKARIDAGDCRDAPACPERLRNHIRGAYPAASVPQQILGAQDDAERCWLDFDHRAYFASRAAFS